jgi:hypothetical protein
VTSLDDFGSSEVEVRGVVWTVLLVNENWCRVVFCDEEDARVSGKDDKISMIHAEANSQVVAIAIDAGRDKEDGKHVSSYV